MASESGTDIVASAPGDPSAGAGRHLLAFMFTDVIGSTALKVSLTTAGYLPLLRRHDQLLRHAVASSGGHLRQDTGDGCFADFATSSDAVNAALTFQWLMAAEPWPEGRALASRVGIHLGEVAETEVRQEGGQKLVGMAVDLAARVMSLAQGGQILMTKGAYNDARQFLSTHPMEGAMPLQWMEHGRYLFKGSAEEMEVFEVGVEGRSPLAAPPDSEKASRVVEGGNRSRRKRSPAVSKLQRGKTVRRRAFLGAAAAGVLGTLAIFRPWKTPVPLLVRLAIDDTDIQSLFFSHDQKHLVACGKTSAKVWRVEKSGHAVAMVVQLDGTSLDMGAEHRPLSTEPDATFNGKTGFSTNHRFLLAGGWLFDLAATGFDPRPIHVESDAQWNRRRHGVRVSPDGKLAALAETLTRPGAQPAEAGMDVGATLIGLRDKTIHTRLTGKHTDKINALAFSPDGTQLLTGDAKGLIGVWDITNPAEARPVHWLKDHKATIHRLFFCAGAKGLLLCSQDFGNETILWDAQPLTSGGRTEYLRRKVVMKYGGYSAALDAAGRRLVVGYSQTQGLFCHDAESFAVIGRCPENAFRFEDAAMSADGRTVVAGTWAGEVANQVNPFEENKDRGKVYIWTPGASTLLVRQAGDTGRISAVAITGEGRRVAAVEDGTVYAWDMNGK